MAETFCLCAFNLERDSDTIVKRMCLVFQSGSKLVILYELLTVISIKHLHNGVS